MTVRELPAERVRLSLDDLEHRFVFSLHPPNGLGFVYAGITQGIGHVTPGIFGWGEKRVERKALRVARRLMRRRRLTQAYAEFWYWPRQEAPYRVVEVQL